MTPASFALLVVGIACGTIVGNLTQDRFDAWLTRRRSQELERRVSAELLSRGVSFDHISLEAISRGGGRLPRVTDEAVRNTADMLERLLTLPMPPES